MIVCGIALFLVLVVRLFQLQIIRHDFYETKAIEQQVWDTEVTAARGTIYDANGDILAMSASVATIYISPREVYTYDIVDADSPHFTVALTEEFIAEGLAEILEIEPQVVLDKLAKKDRQYETIALKVEPSVSERVRQFKKDYDIDGLYLQEDSKRYYPYSSLASHVIGYVGAENRGLLGLELVYDDYLTGVDGRIVRAKNAVGTDMLFTSFEDYYDAVDGYDMGVTIDSTIQYYMEKHLAQAARDFDLLNGAGAIAMDVKTAKILGMVSLGNFDLNNYQDVSEDVKALIDAEPDPELASQMLTEAQLQQWRNKTVTDTYEPGSTFKILTLAMALNEGVVHENDGYYCGGSIDVPGRQPVNCWKAGGHGAQTLTQALQHSCNVAFVQIGMRLGAEKFYDYAEAFGLFEAQTDKDVYLTGKTGIDLNGESGSMWWPENLFTNPDNKTQLAAASFGQTFTITPLQLITAVSACVNGGNLMRPYLVEEIIDSEGVSIMKREPELIRQVISSQTSAEVCRMLEMVVGDVEGTGKNAAVAGFRIGGKTGTSTNTVLEAETGEKQYIVSFVGVAPMDDPQIAILVFLDSPSADTGIYRSGGQMGAPTVGKMFADILPYMGIEPVYDEQEAAIIDKAVPDVSGMSADEASAKLSELGFTNRTMGTGELVTKQLPAAGSVIAAGSQVILYFGVEPGQGEATMPDLQGLTYAMARQKLAEQALFIRASGAITDPAQIIILSQSVGVGQKLEYGAVIEVSVIDTRDQNEF
jgi:stage V sporulation protein D (sporulation-specific penicillin-binding protein)